MSKKPYWTSEVILIEIMVWNEPFCELVITLPSIFETNPIKEILPWCALMKMDFLKNVLSLAMTWLQANLIII